MAGRKRNKAERLRDLATVSEWYVEGMPQWKMAEHLGLSAQQITYDLKQVRKEWREKYVDVGNVIMAQIAKYDQIEAYAWESFLASREGVATQVSYTPEEDEETGRRVPKLAAAARRADFDLISKEGPQEGAGDIRWLDLVDKCIVRRLQLLDIAIKQGVGAAELPSGVIEGEFSVSGTSSDADRVRATDALIKRARSRLEQIAARRDEQDMGRQADEVDASEPAAE